MKIKYISILTASVLFAAGCTPPPPSDGALSGAQLQSLLSDGLSMKLGGQDLDYSGQLTLAADGTGTGYFQPDGEGRYPITGTWEIRGDQLCRSWAQIDDGKEACETWVATGPTSVEVFVDGKSVGVNSW